MRKTPLDNEDSVKKIFGKKASDIFSTSRNSRSKLKYPNTFYDNAGPEEMKHLKSLLVILNDTEIAMLTEAVGINFGKTFAEIDRGSIEGVLDEADREDFYREYKKLIDQRENT